MRLQPRSLIPLAAFLATLAPLSAQQPAAKTPPPAVTGNLVATLEDKRINESSGLALSARDPSIFWTHNDSGGEPCLFALSRQGKTLAKLRIRDAVNFDWEDIASGRDAAGQPVLFVADIGDNFFARPTVQVYQVPEPPLPANASKEIESEKPVIYHAAYPAGRLNAESLLQHPGTGRLYIITKDAAGHSGLYAFPATLIPTQMMVLEKVTDIDFPLISRKGKRLQDAAEITAACFSPNGSRLIVASYSYLYEWRLPADEPLATALKKPPTVITPPLTSQMEALCYDADGRTLWLTSERLPTPLIRISRAE